MGMRSIAMVKSGKTGQGNELAELWAGAMIFAPHIAGCTCAGFHVPLDPASIEADLIDYLAHRYKTEHRTELAAFVNERLEKRHKPFGQWLEALDEAPIEESDRLRLFADLRATLESMNSARQGRSGFVCY